MRRALAIALLGLAAAAPSAGAQATGAHWERLLPPLPSPTEPQPGPVAWCDDPTIACIEGALERLAERRDALGCDHRAVFATTYLELTGELHEALTSDPRVVFDDPEYLFYEDARFAEMYLQVLDADRGAQPPAWRIAFDAAARRDLNAAQDMLLGINAHVQRDMPFLLEELGIRTSEGASRKPDHDRMNEVLERAYQRVVDAVAERYDPTVRTTNASWHPADDVGGLELVRSWREGVWRNAERLLNARSAAERDAVAEQIERHAAGWAHSIAAVETPGQRERRARYCADRVGG